MNAAVWEWVTGLQVAVTRATRNLESARKKHTSLKLNRIEERLTFIGEEHENDLSRKYMSKNTAATST